MNLVIVPQNIKKVFFRLKQEDFTDFSVKKSRKSEL